MKYQKLIYVVALALGMLSISGGASSNALERTAQLPSVPVRINAEKGIQAKSVSISPSKEGFFVHGRVSNQFGYTRRAAHVHVLLKDSDNRLRKEYTTSINPVRIPIPRQGKRGVSNYIVNVSERIEKGDWIEVVVHTGSKHHNKG